MKKISTLILCILLSGMAQADPVSDAENEYQQAQEILAKAQELYIRTQLKFEKAKKDKEEAEKMARDQASAKPWTSKSWALALKSMPKGDATRGAALTKQAYCVSCHGAKGAPLTDSAPALAAQLPAFIYKALLDYKSGLIHIDNKSLVMQGAAAALSKQDMADLATYYSQQKLPPKKKAKKKPNIPLIAGMCAGCHGSKGEGGANDSGPALAQLNSYYLHRQLKAFQQGERQSEVNHMMQTMMSSLSDKQIKEIVAYLAAI